ncbi:MAG: P-II family nitrogen regulator [Thermodesulfobacteriota bacterium]|nr:P-II family nitrogen regulator [Thermodesulfobacteriota bacterium]
MKKIEIITRPSKLEEVKSALTNIGVQGMTLTNVKGFGRQHGHKEVYRGSEYQVDFLDKVKIDVVTAADKIPEILDVVQKAAKTNQIGDGKIFVSPVEEVVRIRTGETGPEAI